MAEKKKPPNGKTPGAGQPTQPVAQAASIAARIEWHFPEQLIGRYANQIMVQMGPNECNISFFEIQPPVIVGATEEEVRQQERQVTTVRANCVARLIVPNEMVGTIAKAIGDVWAKYSAAKQASQTSSGTKEEDGK
jgi:hypothetical protein